jgi:hypothetical protein
MSNKIIIKIVIINMIMDKINKKMEIFTKISKFLMIIIMMMEKIYTIMDFISKIINMVNNSIIMKDNKDNNILMGTKIMANNKIMKINIIIEY